jgi:hypothetical protein
LYAATPPEIPRSMDLFFSFPGIFRLLISEELFEGLFVV